MLWWQEKQQVEIDFLAHSVVLSMQSPLVFTEGGRKGELSPQLPFSSGRQSSKDSRL